MLKWLQEAKNALQAKDTSDSYPILPKSDKQGRSNIPGIYLTGALGGSDLIKHCIADGRKIARTIANDLPADHSTDHPHDFDVLIAGGGVSGMSAAGKLMESGLRILVIDSGEIFQNLKNFTKGKKILAEPESMKLRSGPVFEEGSIEEVVESFLTYTKETNIPFKEHEKIITIESEATGFRVITEKHSYTAGKVILSFGKTGNPRKAGVSGETDYPEKISHHLSDPELFKDQNVTVYGGGDVAAEAAIALSEVAGNTSIVYRGTSFERPQRKNREILNEKIESGIIKAYTGASLNRVDRDSVTIKDKEGNKQTLENDHLFEMIGSDLPVRLLNKIGIKLDGMWDAKRWSILAGSFIVVYLLYAWKKAFFPFTHYAMGISDLPGVFKNPSFWYSLLYTVLMIIFGVKAALRWKKGQNGTHQVMRFTSLIIFQLLSFILIECLFAVFLPGDVWWRAYAINNPFPLLFDSFYNMSGVSPTDLKWMIVALGFVMTFVVIPLFVRRHGKRFCTWVCGCGGLAETLGDTWRHLSPKGKRSRQLEFANGVILFWASVSCLVILFVYQGNTGASGFWHSGYSLVVDFWLVAVIPVALYPVMGGKMWCRYFCPLAKYMQILSKKYGRLSIGSRDKCIKCTLCSKYCQVGVDVMAFAKNEDVFSNRETSCIHCGICINVCPVDNLYFNLLDKKKGVS